MRRPSAFEVMGKAMRLQESLFNMTYIRAAIHERDRSAAIQRGFSPCSVCRP